MLQQQLARAFVNKGRVLFQLNRMNESIAADEDVFVRFKDEKEIHCNAQMNSRLLEKWCVLDDDTKKILHDAMTRFDMSARAYDRILKVARTIADLEGAPQIQSHHIAEAVGYRSLERASWGE